MKVEIIRFTDRCNDVYEKEETRITQKVLAQTTAHTGLLPIEMGSTGVGTRVLGKIKTPVSDATRMTGLYSSRHFYWEVRCRLESKRKV